MFENELSKHRNLKEENSIFFQLIFTLNPRISFKLSPRLSFLQKASVKYNNTCRCPTRLFWQESTEFKFADIKPKENRKRKKMFPLTWFCRVIIWIYQTFQHSITRGKPTLYFCEVPMVEICSFWDLMGDSWENGRRWGNLKRIFGLNVKD